MPKSVEVVCVFNRVHGFWGKKSCFSGKLQREKLLLCRGRTCAARSCKVNGHLREGRGPGMPGPYNSVGQLQRVHPPAILRRHQAHVVTVAVSGTIVSSPAQPAKSSLSQVSTT